MSVNSSEEREHQNVSPDSPSESQFKKLVEVISRSQHNYRDLIDNLDQAVFTLSLDGEVRVANRRLSEILGVSFPDLIGHSLAEFIDVPQLADVKRWIPEFVKKGEWSGTISIRLKRDTELRYFSCWLQAVPEDGRVLSVTGWARDITSEHKVEIRFFDLFESLREGIFFTSPGGEILDANPALVRILGYESKKELLCHNFREMYHTPSERDLILREFEAKGFVRDRVIAMRRKDGKRVDCLASGLVIRDAAGRVSRFQGTLVDITERREMEDKLRQEQEFVRRLVSSFPDLVVVLDRDGKFTYASESMKETLGLPPEQFVGRPFDWLADQEGRAKLAELVRKITSGQQVHAQIELRARHADGSWRVLRCSVGPLVDEAGAITGMVTTARDITESKVEEQQAAQKEKFAAMGQMLAGAAHELNNPLTAILGVSELLRERAPDDSSRRHVELVLQQTRRAAGIVQNLLAFSRPPSQGRLKVHLDEIVRQALKFQEPSLERKNITVKLEAQPNLPAVEGDERLLSQVFLNLITNAEQAIASSSDHGNLSVSLRRSGEGILVTFADDGPGISSENIGKLFDPFFTTKRPGGGTGLGLTICLAVTKDHGGTIEVQSTTGAGATFHVLLPVAAQDLPMSARLAPAGGAAEADGLRGHRILVVDDEESIREIVQDGLAARGMNVDCSESSEEALAYLESNPCDAVVCDSNLPGINGEQLFERLRAQRGSSMPRFVLMTGDLVDSTAVEQFSRKGARIVQKPFHVAALASLLIEILQPEPSKAS
jgi:PAS domain S-box-containing protein